MASNTLLESVAAFETQARRAGLNEQWVEAFGRNNLNRLGRLAYAITTPGVAPSTEQVDRSDESVALWCWPYS